MPKIETKVILSILDKVERKISGKGTVATSGTGAVRAERGFRLFISNEDMDGIIKIRELLEKSGLLIDGATETMKHETKKQESGFLGAIMAPMAPALVQSLISSLVKCITERKVRRTGKGQEGGILDLTVLLVKALHGKDVTRGGSGQNGGIFPLLAFPFMLRATSRKGAKRAVRGHNNMDHTDHALSFKQY